MAKAKELLKQAAMKREEASMRRGLAQLLSAGELQHRYERQAHELEDQAAALEKEARSKEARKSRPVRNLCASDRY
jgi:hypothetical protein